MSRDFIKERIIFLSLARWRYGCFIGEWDAEQAEVFRAASQAIEEKLHEEISNLAKDLQLEHVKFKRRTLADKEKP